MELVFLSLLVLLMVIALTSGFPVAFSLPGSAILSIGIAALCGYLFVDDPSAYFVQGGPTQWLTAGVTNFRSLYWDVERDTLIAIPLFVFMGIMLQRSKIAEDLLVAMAQLFGPIPGGLGISVVFVGALLAATTGIVGATVIAMGLISLPAMLRHNYSKSLGAGTICAAGTLGQIIPPSIVLIILADQLASAADIASTARKADFKLATGEFSMPSELDVTSASAGDMFMGALLPGLILVGLYMGYILITALINPKSAPPVPYDGKYDTRFILRVLLALVPPLALIFAVLGSIVMGVATVNQAGAIGAIGAMVMGSYRLSVGKRGAYLPAILSILSTMMILVVLVFFDINIKNIKNDHDQLGVVLASIAVFGLLAGIIWSAVRAFRIDNVLQGVMVETAKTTSMVFIILIGAAMLTSAFRGFGGEELVKEFLGGIPGGFWAQFIVVMVVIFLLGFFLDFIEIAVVVVPIIAPILLADPSANITAVWLGVMIGLNIQTSFLTPPFGFALFYLRGVAPPSLKTTQIYRGAVAFIALQLAGLAIAGYYPSLVNYLPNRIYLTSETAPPPNNPRLQECIEEDLFIFYREQEDNLRTAVDKIEGVDSSYLPTKLQKRLKESFEMTRGTFGLIEKVQEASTVVRDYEPEYRPLHTRVRKIEKAIRHLGEDIEETTQAINRELNSELPDSRRVSALEVELGELKEEESGLQSEIPAHWEEARNRYAALLKAEKRARSLYRRNVDDAYEVISKIKKNTSQNDALIALQANLEPLLAVVSDATPKVAMAEIKAVEKQLGRISDISHVKSNFSKARRALKKKEPRRDKAREWIEKGLVAYKSEIGWRQQAVDHFLPTLNAYDAVIRNSIGLRMQERLTVDQAKKVASCQSVHKDISLHF